MPSRVSYERELKSVNNRISYLSNKIALNDMRIERGRDYGGFFATRGLFLEAERIRHEKRKCELEYFLKEKK